MLGTIRACVLRTILETFTAVSVYKLSEKRMQLRIQTQCGSLGDTPIPHHIEVVGTVRGSLRMDMTTDPGAFLSHADSTKGLLIDVTVSDLMAVRHITISIRQGGHTPRTVNKRQEQTRRGSFDTATYILTTCVIRLRRRRRRHIGFYKAVAFHSSCYAQEKVSGEQHSSGSKETRDGKAPTVVFLSVAPSYLSARNREAMACAVRRPVTGPADNLAAAWSKGTNPRAVVAVVAAAATASSAAAI